MPRSHPIPTKRLNFGAVRDIALALPGVVESTLHGAPSLKLRGTLLACPALHESAEPDSLVVRIDSRQRAKLIATSPAVYYVTDHYLKHPMVLVRLPAITRKQLQLLLEEASRFAGSRAPRKKGI